MNRKVSNFVYGRRGELVAVPLIYALLSGRYEYENNYLVWGLAILVFAAGFAIRLWAQQHLHFRLRMKMKLTNTGPYRLIRNPIYIGNTLICVGVIIASEMLWMIPIELLVCCLVFSLTVAHEERVLTEKYGDEYITFMQQIPRWIPRLSSLSKIEWSPAFLRESMRAEAYNLLFLIPPILKEILHKG